MNSGVKKSDDASLSFTEPPMSKLPLPLTPRPGLLQLASLSMPRPCAWPSSCCGGCDLPSGESWVGLLTDPSTLPLVNPYPEPPFTEDGMAAMPETEVTLLPGMLPAPRTLFGARGAMGGSSAISSNLSPTLLPPAPPPAPDPSS